MRPSPSWSDSMPKMVRSRGRMVVSKSVRNWVTKPASRLAGCAAVMSAQTTAWVPTAMAWAVIAS